MCHEAEKIFVIKVQTELITFHLQETDGEVTKNVDIIDITYSYIEY